MPPERNSPCPCGSGKKYKHCHEPFDRETAQQLNRATQLHQTGQLALALEMYAAILQQQPQNFDALHMTGIVYFQLNDQETALSYYSKALALRQDYPAIWSNAGNACLALRRYDDAILLYRKAIELDPRHAMAWGNLGNALNAAKRHTEALVAWKQGALLDATFTPSLVQTIIMSALRCEWQEISGYAATLLDLKPARVHPAPPFAIMSITTDPAQQLDWATHFARPMALRAASVSHALRRPARPSGKVLTIGYLSADFHAHATAWLMAEVLELHDREAFCIQAYSYGQDDGSTIRQRLASACDAFVDLAGMTDLAAAQRIVDNGVDILVDLKGYTSDARVEIAALRPAPIQVNWLGYPGTMGADFIDYIIADPFVIPKGQEHHYSERVVRLPDCYQPNDRLRTIDPRTPERVECGLPEQGFVFCCLNYCYKITPAVFDVWMSLLREVPGSVLWLLETDPVASENLCREADARGIDPARLVFAPKLPLPQHLARYRIADLFIDTFPVGAHTTASDALWAGLPVLALVGDTFMSRVAGSLLQTVGLPELVTHSLAEYKTLALDLARDPARLGELRQRLSANRDTCALFDTPRFVRHLEKSFLQMWQRHVAGQPPAAFDVASGH